MGNKLFTLVPERVNFESFWIEIRKRNKWLVELRYLAVLLLITFALFSLLIQRLYPEVIIPTYKIFAIAVCILIYNLLFHKLWKVYPNISKKLKVHSLHFSLLQIVTDFAFLMLLIYFTGGVESPFNTFFVFHLIIGSLLLPGPIISAIMGTTLLIIIFGSLLEFYGVIPHYQVYGIIKYPLYNDPIYLVVFFATFAVVVFVSIYLANSIARVLYEREKELYVAYKELEEAEKTKSRYVMTVVHDLKTPINAALTWVDLVANNSVGDVPEYLRNPIERIQVRLRSALDLIDNILKISQVKLSSQIANEDVDLIELFNSLYLKHRILITSKNLRYVVKSSPEKIVFKSDPKLLNMALSNIISNAIKYNEPDGIIEVVLKDLGNYLEISVADDGIGIPDEELHKIFNEFYRSSISKEKNIEGTGLGMALVKEIVTKLGGEISIFSPSYLSRENRRGTQVVIKLPK